MSPSFTPLAFEPSTAALPEGASLSDVDALAQLINALLKAVQSLDVEALAPFYVEDLHWANAFGTRLEGRERVLAYIGTMFGQQVFKGRSAPRNSWIRLWFVDRDTAVINSYQEVSGQRTLLGEELQRRTHGQRIAVRRNGGWLVQSELFYDERENHQRGMLRAETGADPIRAMTLSDLTTEKSPPLQLLGRANSGSTQKVVFLLEELGLPYERQDYGRQFGNTENPEYLALNPTGKVPTLRDGELALWESHTILRHLARKVNSPLYPQESVRRSQVERWLDWALAFAGPAQVAGFVETTQPQAQREPQAARSIGEVLAVLDAQLAAGPWVAGVEFGLADIALGPIVRRSLAYPLDLPAAPQVARWLQRLEARSAFRKAVQID